MTANIARNLHSVAIVVLYCMLVVAAACVLPCYGAIALDLAWADSARQFVSGWRALAFSLIGLAGVVVAFYRMISDPYEEQSGSEGLFILGVLVCGLMLVCLLA